MSSNTQDRYVVYYTSTYGWTHSDNTAYFRYKRDALRCVKSSRRSERRAQRPFKGIRRPITLVDTKLHHTEVFK